MAGCKTDFLCTLYWPSSVYDRHFIWLMFDIFLSLRSLRQNRIKSIEKDAFKSMSNLRHLWVTGVTQYTYTYCICFVNSIYVPAFLDAGLPRGNVHERDSGRRTNQWKCYRDGTYGFSSLSEETRKSNHLKMSLQRRHFLLSYLKTLSVGPAGVWTRDLPLGRPALSQLS